MQDTWPKLDALRLFQESGVTPDYDNIIAQAREFFNLRPSERTETGWLPTWCWETHPAEKRL
jgi:hypothetical protein